MLIQFSIENHRSIKDSAVISFAASKDKSLESYLLHPDEKRALLPAIAIYGANAAGKSNVLHALMTMKDMVVGEAAKISKGQKLPWEPFGGTTTPTSFEIVFIYHGIRYAYGYSFDAKKIYTEYLYHWPNGREALIFSRENGVYEFRENINEQITLSNRTPDNKLYLVSSNDWNLPQTENAYKWFLEKLTFLMEEAPAASETVAQIVSGNEKKARILKELLLADLGISDVTIKNISGKAPVITTTHRVIGADGSVEHFQLLMDQESSGTQLVFCDLSTPKADGSFNVYDDLRRKLLEIGIPENEIAYIHTANTEQKKKELFAKVRGGEVRILMGSTAKMGAGTNVQDRLIALHDLDCPWRPSDLQQRLGRIVRQGNQNPEVEIFRYVTEGTFDAYLYQLVESKQRFIAQIMTSKAPARAAEDVDETALSYAEIKALATGNPQIIEKCNLDMEVSKLNMLRASHLSQRYALEELVLRKYPAEIKELSERIAGYEQDSARLAEHPKPAEGIAPMVLNDVTYAERENAGKAIIEACTHMNLSLIHI